MSGHRARIVESLVQGRLRAHGAVLLKKESKKSGHGKQGGG